VSADEEDFRVRPGPTRSRGGARPNSFVGQVLKAARTAGVRDGGGGRRSGPGGRSTFGRGRAAFARARLFGSQRRVVVQVFPIRHRGPGASRAPLGAHVAYLQRDGVTRDGQAAAMFDANGDQADGRAFAERCQDDRHHFRAMVSPEDAAELTDLKAFTRDLAAQMEADLGTRLDWIAVEHWNTAHPHIHLLVRGVDDQDANLVISRDYISHTLRSRAEELASLELGPRPEHEVRRALERDVTAERWTRLDGEIRRAMDESGFIDLRPDRPGPDDPDVRRLMVGRLQQLERMGLAAPEDPGTWTVSLNAKARLNDLGARGDIIRTLQRTFAERGQARAVGDFVIDTDPAQPIIGRLVRRGLHDEMTLSAYAVVDGVDGRVHHVRFKDLEALAEAPPDGGVVEVRRFGAPADPRPTLVLAARSDLDLAQQVTARGATWLDYRLARRDQARLAMGGFGAEVREAMERRLDHLAAEGLARRFEGRVVPVRNLIATLRERELEAVGERLSAQTGLAYRAAPSGASVAGDYRQRLNLTSGRFAMVSDGLGFSLVPWTSALELQRGRPVSGVVRDDGGIDWSFGRKRGLGL
jgi:type IV secretory pathway VirD2 relaxase